MIDESLLPPPVKPSKPFPWRTALALFIPAAALAAGTGLQRWLEPLAGDPVLHWLAWSSAAGLVLGAASMRKLAWAAWGVAAPWLVAGAVGGITIAARPVREAMADRRESACRAEGRLVCTVRDFAARCEAAQKSPQEAAALLGKPRTSGCAGETCTSQWLYVGPFRPEQYYGPGALACFVMTDTQGRGIRHWLMAAEVPRD
jgi:hypothetical protein